MTEENDMSSDRPTVIAVEQALSMPYATLRFVHLGWRVIRVEPTPVPGRRSKGDPNRYIGRPVAGDDRHSYFVGPNVGKEAIAINLKCEKGRDLLARLVRDLSVDVFCTNTMPMRHEALGIDYETLAAAREALICRSGCAAPTRWRQRWRGEVADLSAPSRHACDNRPGAQD